MADLKYVVDVDLNVDPGTGGRLARVGDPIGKLQKEAGKVGLALAEGFTGAVERVGAFAAGLAKVGAAAGVAGVTYGVVGLNKELETTQVSLAAVLNANKIGGGIEGAMGAAAEWMVQIRKDAKDLPGEFSDLLTIIQSGASAAFNAGLDIPKFERVAAQSMAAAKAMSVPIDQAGRELAQLLEGRAGAQNVFGTRLGIHAEDFRGKTPDQRVQMITAALEKFEPAIKVFGATMDAQSSTLLDNAKLFLGAATMPLFERIKGLLVTVNAWFDANRGTVDRYAAKVGDFLVSAFDRGTAIVMEYGPLLLDFAARAYDAIVKVWADAEPFVKAIGAEIKEFLKSDSSLDKIKTVLQLYITAKGISGVASVASFLAPLAKTVGPGIGAMMGGPGAAGVTATSVTAGGGGAGAAGGVLPALGVSAGAAAAGLALLVSSVAVADHFAAEQQDREKIVGDALVNSYINASATLARGAENASGIIDKSGTDYQETLARLRESSQSLADAYAEGVDKVNAATISLAEGVGGVMVAMNAKLASAIDEINKRPTLQLKAEAPPTDPAKEAKAAAERRKNAGRGSGGTVIHKVEISVSSNQNPGQVARQVSAELSRVNRYRTASPYTRSFTTPGLT